MTTDRQCGGARTTRRWVRAPVRIDALGAGANPCPLTNGRAGERWDRPVPSWLSAWHGVGPLHPFHVRDRRAHDRHHRRHLVLHQAQVVHRLRAVRDRGILQQGLDSGQVANSGPPVRVGPHAEAIRTNDPPASPGNGGYVLFDVSPSGSHAVARVQIHGSNECADSARPPAAVVAAAILRLPSVQR